MSASAAVDELAHFRVAMAFFKWFHLANASAKQWMLCEEPSQRVYGRVPNLNAEIDELVEGRMRRRIDHVLTEREENEIYIRELEAKLEAVEHEKDLLERELKPVRAMLSRSPPRLTEPNEGLDDLEEACAYEENRSRSPSPKTEREKAEALASPGRERRLAKKAAKSWANEADISLMRSP